MAFLTAPLSSIGTIAPKTWVFLILSGVATGASWLCYFQALQKGDVNKVVPIDKSSTVLTMILAIILLGEDINASGILAMFLIGVGTLLMIEKKDTKDNVSEENLSWIGYAFLSALFASLTSILGKIGIEGIDSNLGTAIRTLVVLIMSWVVVFATGKKEKLRGICGKELRFIIVSGTATGASWLCYYKALQNGPASVVVPIDKLSIIVTIVFSRLAFKEHLTRKAFIGFISIIIGTLIIALPSVIAV